MHLEQPIDKRTHAQRTAVRPYRATIPSELRKEDRREVHEQLGGKYYFLLSLPRSARSATIPTLYIRAACVRVGEGEGE